MSEIIQSYDVSPMQAGMLFHSLYSERTGVYVQQMVATLNHELDPCAFFRAWTTLIDLHDLFRTSFHWGEDGKTVQRVHGAVKVAFLREDWNGLTESEQAKRLEAYLEEDKSRGFDLDDPPLMRMALFSLADKYHKLIWTSHHALLDGRSRVLALKELFAIYDALVEGKELKLDNPKPYREYVDWLNGLDMSRAEAFWKNLLEDFVAPTPLPCANFSGKLNTGGTHAERIIRLPEDLTSGLASIAKQEGLSLNTILQGAWALLLGAYSGNDDVVFGATRACRRSALEGAESMIGLFINTVPVRAKIRPEASLMAWLRELRAQNIAVRDFEHTPLVSIFRWSQVAGGASLFDSIVVFENHSLDAVMKAQGKEWEKRSFHILQRSNYAITLAAYLDRELLIKLEYDTNSFHEPVILRLCNELKRALELIASDPYMSVSQLDLLNDEQRHHLLVEYNDTQRDYPEESLIHELIEQQAVRTPDRVAVVSQRQSISYRELDERANQLANYLKEGGAGPEQVVGVCMTRGIEMVVSLVGVLKSGAAYLPLDPAYPQQRLAFMMEDAGMKLLVTEKAMRGRVPQRGARRIEVDEQREEIRKRSRERATSNLVAGNLAYVIYTSGSTGAPKGAMICHRSVVNLMTALKESVYRNAPQRPLRISLNGPIAFDTSVKQFIQLASGHAIHVVPQEVREDPEALMDLISSGAIDVFDSTPSMVQMLIDCGLLKQETLPAIVLLGGEAIDGKMWQSLASCKTTDFYNVYGPTEATVNAAACHMQPDIKSPVIGRPLSNISVYVLNEHIRPVEKGAVGELFIAGEGVCRGYIGKPEQTAECFQPDPFSRRAGQRMYRTGDLCRFSEDGRIEYLCRKDEQVKIRGYRVEPGEVEAALRKQKGVRQAAVVVKDSEQAGKLLIGYVVAEAGVSGRQVRESVRQELPDHMVPQVVVLIGEMPLTANGKLDRKMLKSMAEVEPEQVEAVKERAATAVEEIIAGIWQEVLKRESVGLTQNFFDLGGHSLLATQVIVRVRRAFNVEIGLKKLFEKATVEGLARVVEQMKRSGAGPSTSAIRRVPRLGIAAAAAQQECGKECLLSALHDSSQHNQLADPIVVKRG